MHGAARTSGAAIDHYEFFESSSGSVHGVVLKDGRAVVVKGHRPSVACGYLDAIADVQTALADAGSPAPRPLIRPLRVGFGHVTAETMLPRSPATDAHAPEMRAAVAYGLARFIETARPYTDHLAGQRPPLEVSGDQLYPTPHSPRFDFEATSGGAEWIDALAREARAHLQRPTRGPYARPRRLAHRESVRSRRAHRRGLRLGQHRGRSRNRCARHGGYDVQRGLAPTDWSSISRAVGDRRVRH